VVDATVAIDELGRGGERDVLWQLVNAHETARVIHIVATLGIADLVADDPKDASELARATQTHGPTLYRLLRAACSVGVLHEDEAGRFTLTPRAHYLRADVPSSVRAWAMMIGSASFWSSRGELLESVPTGETAFPKLARLGVCTSPIRFVSMQTPVVRNSGWNTHRSARAQVCDKPGP
jgi:hypothetical protein